MPQREISRDHFGFWCIMRYASLTFANSRYGKARMGTTDCKVIPGGRTLSIDATGEVGVSEQ
eukprot:9885224-Heterocapsa_arctica.AAC.1